jgi:hypothetical protein
METPIVINKMPSGEYITYSTKDPLIGTIELEQTVKYFDVVKDKSDFEKRVFKLCADVISLQKTVIEFEKSGFLNGRIFVKEFEEGSIPDEYTNKYLKSSIVDLEKHVKYCEEKPFHTLLPALTSCGSKIYRFFGYDAHNSVQDTVLEYDLLKSIFNNKVGYNPYNNADFSSILSKDSSSVNKSTQSFQKSLDEISRIKPTTYEDVNPVSRRITPTQQKQYNSTSSNTEKTKSSVEEKNTLKEQSSFGKYFSSIFISLVIVAYVGSIIIENDRIARTEGSSLWDQLMLLLAAIGIYAIYKTFKKK